MNWSSAEHADQCAWNELAGRTVSLRCSRRKLTAVVRCDPERPQRLCLSTLMFWRYRYAATSAGRDERPLPPTHSELSWALDALLTKLGANGLTPELVLLEPDEQLEFWQQWLEQEAEQLVPHRRENMTALAWRLIEVVPFLDRRPFGLELATRLAARLKNELGGLAYGHPYYCGHALVFNAGRYGLEVVEDGMPDQRLATWPDERAFIAAVATWSDYLCSGADPSSASFVAESAFYLSNQRITRARIEEFIEAPPSR